MIIDILLVILSVFLFLSSLFWGYLLLYMLYYRVPLISTSPSIIAEALTLAAIKPHEHVLELGCGWAPFLFTAARAEPNAQYTGVEVLKPILWWNRLRAKKAPIKFLNQNFFKVDLATYDVIYCYLWDTIMTQIYDQKWADLKSGCRLVSYDFPIKTLRPEKIRKIGKSTLYLYIKK